jgi:hypothetical protein
MYFATITFSIALLGIIVMIVSKHFEIKGGKKYVLSRLADRTDHVFQTAYTRTRFVISHINKGNAIASIQWLAFHILSFFRTLYLHIREAAHRHPHSKKVIDMVTGKIDVNQNGGASFYLKQIAEETKK